MGKTNHHSKAWLLAGMVVALAATTSAEVNVMVDFASAYAFRGSISDKFVIQPSIEFSGLGLPEKYGYALVGTWSSLDLDDNFGTTDRAEFYEIDWYGYYSLPTFIDSVEIFVGYTAYTYPNTDSVNDHETNIGIAYTVDGLYLGATAYAGVGGDIKEDLYYYLSAYYIHGILNNLEGFIGVMAGYYDPVDEPSEWNDTVLDVGLSYAFNEVWSAGVSVYYVALLYEDDPIASGDTVGVVSFGAYF